MDLLKLLLFVVLLNAVAIGWVLRSRQRLVPKSSRFCAAMSLKICGICMSCFAVFYGLLGLPADVLVCSALVVVGLCAIPNLDVAQGDPLVLAILFPFYIVQQYVLGYPDKDLLLATPPSSPNPNFDPRLVETLGRTATVVATLRPVGRVAIEGTEFNARTVGGDYVDVDVPMIVRRIDRDMLIVETQLGE
ncbi:MAG: hypothetical protein ACTHK7_17525 [Aureliella sp.]